MRVVVVDDEPPARRKVLRLLGSHTDVEVVGEADSGREAVRVLRDAKPDVVFLDVQLPDMDGFEVLRRVPGPAPFRPVFVTAFDAFAVKAFEANAIDYLLKPVCAARFDAMIERARNAVAAGGRERPVEPRFLVTDRARVYWVPAARVDWLEADRNYVVLHGGGAEHIVRGTLESFARTLPSGEFIRISRSHVVRRDAIIHLRPAPHGERIVRLRDGVELGWTRRYRD